MGHTWLGLLYEALLVETGDAPGDLGSPLGLLFASTARNEQPSIGPAPNGVQAIAAVPQRGDIER